jgi:hypothetical protein
MPQVYLRADFKDIHAKPMTVPPTLEAVLAFTLNNSGPGHPMMLPEGASTVYITGVVPYLFWREPGEGDWYARSIAAGSLAPGTILPQIRPAEGACECTLLFQLSSELVSKLEGLRNGRKAKFRLTLRVTGHYTRPMEIFSPPRPEVVATGKTRVEQIEVPFSIDSMNVSTGRGENSMDIEVEKSRWAEEVLPVLGYGVWKTYEIPISDLPALGKVDEYIEQAAKQFEIGEWKASLARSRDAVQTLEPYLKKYGNPVYSDRKGGPSEQKFGDLTDAFSKLASTMYEFQSKVFGLLSAGSHPEADGTTVERADAELGLTVAMACRRYVGSRMLKEPGTR